MKQNLYPEKLQVSLDTFLQKMHLLNRADNPPLVLKMAMGWTNQQPLLTKKLLEYILQSEAKIHAGEEGVAIEKIIRNRLLKEFKQDELTLNIRKSLYKKDLENVLEITDGLLQDCDRLYLKRIQNNLGLTDSQCRAIEDRLISLERYLALDEDRRILAYENNINNLSAISSNEGENNNFAALEINPKEQQLNNQKWRSVILILLTPLLFFSFRSFTWLRQNRVVANNNVNPEQQKLCVDLASRQSPRMSLGEKLLTKEYGQLKPASVMASHEGMAAFARCEFSLAQQKYQQSLAIEKNNPEALIYYNNANAIAQPHFKIAVSIPLGSKPSIAWEILRGVAQAQSEINREGGIRNRSLLVQIVNDDNNPNVVEQVAQQLSADQNILAVVGHNDSNSSLAAGKIYEREKLVMISPTSTSTKLSGMGNHVMRTIPSVSALAEKLASYAVSNSLTDIAICRDSEDSASRSFSQEFGDRITSSGGSVKPIDCDLAKDDLEPDSIVARAIAENADAILLAPSVNKMNQAIAVARSNRQQLPLLGNHSLYTYETIATGREAISGMVIPSPWLADLELEDNFSQAAMDYWGGKVNWRTAMAHDAVVVIAQGLEDANNRSELQAVLTKSDFSVTGATGKFQFSQGDRLGKIQLAYVKKSPAENKYQFSRL